MALQLVVEDTARNPIAAMYGALPKSRLEALDRVIAQFEPRLDRLWSVQSIAMEEAAAHLGFAFLLKGDPKGALDLAQEAVAHGLSSKELLRVNLLALSDFKLDDQALELARARRTDLTCESIVVVAELAAKRGDIQFVEEALVQTRGWSPECPLTLDVLCLLRWTALARAGERSRVIKEIADAKIQASTNLTLICGAARVLYRVNQPLEATELIDRAKLLLDSESSESDRFMLAELLFKAERWMEAAALYEPLTPVGQISELYIRLLTCYVNADSRKKAKALLNRLPNDWVENDEIRHLAISLGQNARDWAFLLPLIDAQVGKAPAEAVSWLFKIHVTRHSEALEVLQDTVRQVPEELGGSIRNLAQIAGLELRYGESERGLRRLYRLVRNNFEEPEAFSAYFISIMSAPGSFPLMEDKLQAVVAGSSVTLGDDAGDELQVVVDPLDVNALPGITNFLNPDSPQAKSLLGATVGDTVDVPGGTFGGTRKYTIKAIQSAYRRLIQLATERANSVSGLPHLKKVHVGTSGDTASDLIHMHNEVKRSTEICRQIIEAYGDGYLTLSILAKMLGRSSVDVVSGWPSNAPPIFVGTGVVQERNDALVTLARTDASYVTDALTLTELVNLGASEMLAALPKIYISPVTMEVLEDNLRDAEEDKSAGTVMDLDGQLRFIEFNEKLKQVRISVATELVNIAKKYCIVQPAYGELIPPAGVPQFVDKLTEEERELLLLAKDHNSTLLTLDGRLRLLATAFAGINGVWPQALLMHCLSTGQITSSKSEEFTIKQFLSNRTFVSLTSNDLIWMVLQGDDYIQRGIQAFKQYSQSPETEFISLKRVTLEFLATMAKSGPQIIAFGEFLVHIMEPLFRRKDCPVNFHNEVKEFVANLVEQKTGVAYLYPPANRLELRKVYLHRKYFSERLNEAYERSKNPVETRPVAVRALYCTKKPYLILDKKNLELATEEHVHVGNN
jgi:tetratricopeptide (TPR) repeat protein